jgi:hypothetical protein
MARTAARSRAVCCWSRLWTRFRLRGDCIARSHGVRRRWRVLSQASRRRPSSIDAVSHAAILPPLGTDGNLGLCPRSDADLLQAGLDLIGRGFQGASLGVQIVGEGA